MSKRECGECTLCCTVTEVTELKKPFGVTCSNCSKGCTIYASRPTSCRTFECAWLQGEMPLWMRPDKVHVMIEKLPNVKTVIALAEPGYEGRWVTPEVTEVLQRYSDKDVAVVSLEGNALIPKGRNRKEIVAEIKFAAHALGVF